MPQYSPNPYKKQVTGNVKRLPENQIDGWIMTESAQRLARAGQQPEDNEGMLTALRLNWRMWTIIQSELMSEENPLPDEVRFNLLALSNFIDKQTVKAMGSLKVEDLDILIKINRELAAGLNGNPGPGATTAAPAEEKAEKSPPPQLRMVRQQRQAKG